MQVQCPSMDETRWSLYVRGHMAAKGWTQADLARHAGVAQSLVSRWLKGGGASIENARAVSRAIGRPLPEVLVAAELVTPEEMDIEVPPILRDSEQERQHIRQIVQQQEALQNLAVKVAEEQHRLEQEMLKRNPELTTLGEEERREKIHAMADEWAREAATTEEKSAMDEVLADFLKSARTNNSTGEVTEEQYEQLMRDLGNAMRTKRDDN